VPILNFYPSSIRRELWHSAARQPGAFLAVLLISAQTSVWPEVANMASNKVVYDVQFDEQYEYQSPASCGRNNSNMSDISAVSLSSSHTYASTPGPTTPTGNLHWKGYSTITKTEHSSSSLTPSQWDSQFPTFDQPDSTRWTPITLGWPTNSELLKLYKFIIPSFKEPYFQLMDSWTPTPQTPAKVYLDNPE
jgi:hypothetical protein